MSNLLNNISDHIREQKTEENLFVKNIIVNKGKQIKKNNIYVPTEKWVMQLGKRLEINCQSFQKELRFRFYFFQNKFYLTHLLKQIKDPNW